MEYDFLFSFFLNVFHFPVSDIDECLSISCHVNAECLDSHGSYICRCKTGFNGNGTSCESKQPQQQWGKIFCLLFPNSFHFFMFTICYFPDVDECLNNPCHINASCTDNEGSFDCQCNVGFSGDGVNCTSKISFFTSGFLVITLPSSQCFIFLDIDECLNNPCHHNASCTDNEGSFDCQCNVGFSGDGISNCASKCQQHGILLFRFFFLELISISYFRY